MTTPPGPVRALRPLTSVTVLWIYAFLPANLIPSVIGRLVNDYGFDVTIAGFLATGMTLLNSATVFIVRPLVRRGYRSSLAVTGAILLIVACIIGIIVPTPGVIAPLLLVAGVASGLALAAASAALSATPNPERSTNIAMIFNRLVVAIAYFLVPVIGTSIETIFLLIAVPGIVVLCTAYWLPNPPRRAAPELDVRTGEAGRLAWLLAIGMGLLAVTDDGVIGVSEVISVGFFGDSGSTLALNLYAIAILAGLVGALITPWATRALGRIGALSAALGLSFLGKIALLLFPNEAVFAAGYIAWGLAFGLCLPIVFGIAAALRKDGSASVAVNGVYVLGVALGPTVASQLLALGGTALLAAAVTVLSLGSAVLMILVARNLERARSTRDAEASSPSFV